MTIVSMLLESPPFDWDQQLFHEDLESQERSLGDAACSKHSLSTLRDEFYSPRLEAAASKFWYLSTQSSASIRPLHAQNVKGRAIILTESPDLHLLWHSDRIFIKPLPKYMLSWSFWDDLLSRPAPYATRADEDTVRAALGFLRTYYHLIRHESDLRVAQREDLQLIPLGITWPAFISFRNAIGARIADDAVSARYQYGELRLSRLNLFAPLLFGRWQYERVHGQYGEHFARFYGPVLFAFGVLSTLLSCFQVGLAVEALEAHEWRAFWDAARWFSVGAMVGLVLVAVGLAALWVYMVLDECVFAIRARRRGGERRREVEKLPK